MPQEDKTKKPPKVDEPAPPIEVDDDDVVTQGGEVWQ